MPNNNTGYMVASLSACFSAMKSSTIDLFKTTTDN